MTCYRCDIATAKAEPDPKRKNYERVTCSTCGKFLGYRPKPKPEK